MILLYYNAGFGFKPIESIADDALSSDSSSFLDSLAGCIFFKIKSLISSPDSVSYTSSAFAIL